MNPCATWSISPAKKVPELSTCGLKGIKSNVICSCGQLIKYINKTDRAYICKTLHSSALLNSKSQPEAFLYSDQTSFVAIWLCGTC